MSLSLEQISDIDERFNEVSHIFDARHSAMVKSVSKSALRPMVGEDLLLPYHTAWAAYLLGFDNTSMLARPEGRFTFSVPDRESYKDIVALIPKEGIIFSDESCLSIPCYKRTGVEEAFRKLHEERKLNYSPERFQYAVNYCGLKHHSVVSS